MNAYPLRLIELAERLATPHPWNKLKELPRICEELRVAEETALHEFSQHDPVLSMQIPNPKPRGRRAPAMVPNPEYPKMYVRLKRINTALQNNPQIASLRSRHKEVSVIVDQLFELEKLVREHAPRLIGKYTGYVDLGKGFNLEKEVLRMRKVLACLHDKNHKTTKTKKDKKDTEAHLDVERASGKPLRWSELGLNDRYTRV